MRMRCRLRCTISAITKAPPPPPPVGGPPAALPILLNRRCCICFSDGPPNHLWMLPKPEGVGKRKKGVPRGDGKRSWEGEMMGGHRRPRRRWGQRVGVTRRVGVAAFVSFRFPAWMPKDPPHERGRGNEKNGRGGPPCEAIAPKRRRR